MHYQRYFDEAIDRLKAERRYRVFADLERLIPANERLVRFLDEQRLDAVVCISRINFRGEEADVVKAARAAGIRISQSVSQNSSLFITSPPCILPTCSVV